MRFDKITVFGIVVLVSMFVGAFAPSALGLEQTTLQHWMLAALFPYFLWFIWATRKPSSEDPKSGDAPPGSESGTSGESEESSS